MTARSLVLALLFLFGVLQYELWMSSNGIAETFRLKQSIAANEVLNQQLIQRNALLASHISEFKQGKASVEEAARNEVGMIKPDETYYQFVNE